MRGTVLFLYAFHFLVAADGNAIIPLIPEYTEQFDLSVFHAGLLVGIPAAAMLVLSLPVGVLSDRIGARTVTITASAILTVSALGQALASSYAVLLASWGLSSGSPPRSSTRPPPPGSRPSRRHRGASPSSAAWRRSRASA